MQTPGEWDHWTYGTGIQGWTLRCGKLEADIRVVGSPPYYLMINHHPIANSDDLLALQQLAEQHIAKRIGAVLPAYRLIRQRLRARARYEASIVGPSAFKPAKSTDTQAGR